MEEQKKRDVAAIYDNQAQAMAKRPRETVAHLDVRTFNNWIKSVLIEEMGNIHAPRFVDDLCCGKGGDLKKWSRVRGLERYFGYDISEDSIQEARRRYRAFRTLGFTAQFSVDDVTRITRQNRRLNMVSIQFALHYFGYPDGLDRLFYRIRDSMNPQVIMGTVADGDYILRTMLPETIHVQGNPKKPGDPYTFHLEDAVGGAEEYVTTKAMVKEAAGHYGYKLQQWIPFEDFYRFYRHYEGYGDYAQRLDITGIPELSKMYSVFVIIKTQ